MTQKPFPWRKLTPAQIELMERLAAAGGALPYDSLGYREMTAFNELQKLKFADMRVKGRRKLEAYVTAAGRELKADAYQTEQIVVRVTPAQIELLRNLNDALPEDSVGFPIPELPGSMQDVCRRMSLRGWVEWYEGWDKRFWARLTPAGREVLAAVGALDQTIIQFDEIRRRRGLI